jgi:DNA transformation protein
MSTSKDTIEFILDKLKDRSVFSIRSMFGEFALYAKGKTVAFVCEDTLFVKILPASENLAKICEQGPAYPSSKPYYVIEESQLDMPELPSILLAIADSIPAKKK